MIKNILLPENFRGYYLFPKRVIGFYVDDYHVSAAQVFLKGDKAIVEHVIHETVAPVEGLSNEERVSATITSILDRVGKYDAIYTALPSSQVIFKTLKLPFLDYEQIRMVVHFEVEPLLPFSLDQAVIDFIVTKQFPEENSSEIIVAAVQKSVVAEHFAFFDHVPGGPEKIGIDLFGLYGLYQKIPSYMGLEGGVALIDTGVRSTRVAFIQNGQLKAVRVLLKGSEDFVTRIAMVTGRTHDEIRGRMASEGVTQPEDKVFYDAVTKELQSFLASVQFTLGSFASRENQQGISRFILSGAGTHIAGINEFITQQTGVASEYFQISQLFVNKKIELKKTRMLEGADLMSLGAALPSTTTQDFNLLPEDVSAVRDNMLLGKQVITAAVFVVALFASFFVFSFMQTRSMRQELEASQEEAAEALRKVVEIPEDETDFDEIVSVASRAVNKEENMWFPFSAQSQFLRYLLELHMLDKEGLGLEVERVAMTKDSMSLKAKVKDYEAIAPLEQALKKSKLFRYESSIQKPDFSIKIGLSRS